MPFSPYGIQTTLATIIQGRSADAAAVAALESAVSRPELPSYVVAALPSAVRPGRLIYVTNEAGGAVPAFSDGTNWRRVTDRNVVS